MKRIFTLIIILATMAVFKPAYSDDSPGIRKGKIKSLMLRHGLIPQAGSGQQDIREANTMTFKVVRDGDTLVYHSRDYYDYNAENLLSQNLKQFWTEGQYQDSKRNTYSYDEQGKKTQKLYEYMGLLREWIMGGRTTYTYDAQGFLINELDEDYINSVWQSRYQSVFTYDENGNMTLSILELKGAVVARLRVSIGELNNNRLVWHIPGEVNNGIYLYRLETGVRTYSGQVLISR